jgi:hypothetical protein
MGATTARNPITYERCPVHRRLVSFDGDGRMLGCCDGCAREAAQGILDIQEGVAKANQWSRETLNRLGRRPRG